VKPYLTHRLPIDPALDLAVAISSALAANPDIARALLDGWIDGRTAQLDLDSIRIDSVSMEGERGDLNLSFEEASWAACRMETLRAPHHCRISFRRDGEALWLDTLPRNAFGERSDEL